MAEQQNEQTVTLGNDPYAVKLPIQSTEDAHYGYPMSARGWRERLEEWAERLWYGNKVHVRALARWMEEDLPGLLAEHASLTREVAELRAEVARHAETAKAVSFMEAECLDLRCVDICGGEDVAWVAVEHFMAEPRKREVGRGSSPLAALRTAMNPEHGSDEVPFIEH